MSALLPGQDALKRRACLGTHSVELLDWFLQVETEAWGWVKSHFPQNRPKKIFLVTGQTLTNEFSISHLENSSESCEITVAADVAIPSVVEGGIFVGRDSERIVASRGFQNVVPKAPQNEDSGLYSIFLEVENSGPITPLLGISMKCKSLLRFWFRSTFPFDLQLIC